MKVTKKLLRYFFIPLRLVEEQGTIVSVVKRKTFPYF